VGNINLTINEALPFEATYQFTAGESLVTVNQSDIEEFVMYHKRIKRLLTATTIALFMCVSFASYLSYKTLTQSQSTYIFVDSEAPQLRGQ